jgi:glycosyltransferase involved in cell wall biosynthesis
MKTSPRVLLIAEAANPEWVSVPLVGWSHAEAIHRVTPSHLVTQVRNRDAVKRAGWIEGQDFTAIDSELVARRAAQVGKILTGGKGTGWTTKMALNALSFPYFEHLVWKQFAPRLRAGEFDIVHHLTPLSPTIAPKMASLCKSIGVPFVWGPLNGGVAWPKGFDKARRKEKEWLSYIRGIYKFHPRFGSARRDASAILIASRATWEQMPRSFHHKCVYLPENAIDPAKFNKRRSHRATRPIKAIFIGRLVPYKGADMLLEAAAPLIRMGLMTLDIVGDGPQMPMLREMVSRDDLAQGVNLAGWVDHAKVQDWLIDSDVMAFPSIREFGGGVALEAMAVGVPPIVPDYGGLGELVTNKNGFLIPMGTRQQIIERLRHILGRLAEHPEEIDAKSEPAYRRAFEQFTWDAKAQQTLQVYEWVLGRAEKPNFGMPIPDLPPTAA